MYVNTYTCTTDEHNLTPTLTAVDSNVTTIFKSDVDPLNPVIVVSNNMSRNFNYIYISEFDRYYFCKVVRSQNMYLAECHVDPLYSWKTYIDELEIIANRSSSRFNVYQPDAQVSFLQKSVIATQKFPYGFNGQSLILAVNGG